MIGGGGEDGQNMIASVDEKTNAIIVINATGIIQMSNKVHVGAQAWS